MWSKLMTEALKEKVIVERFTFHDLRVYYVTRHKAERGALPDLHANPATTVRVHDRTKIVKECLQNLRVTAACETVAA
ncbi:hypothetical protein [Burkholderia sp. Bp8998]|uniref:hypothetical protein n=1 Tax=Burkholderia sp. Bp8998 TaxID=2184557 RepID=UPI0021AB671F|nr:hypothetical protein [Burkholderia sp. Bp8998]